MDTCKQKDNRYNENKRNETKINVMPYFSNIRNYNSVFFFFTVVRDRCFYSSTTIMNMMLH